VLAGNAPHQLDFVDINEDGFIDIFVSDHGDSFWGVSPKLKKNGIGFGNKILINDGTGHFVVVGHHLIGKGLDYGSTMIPSISNDGIIRFTRIDGDGTNQIEVDIVEFEYRYSTGPNGRNSAELGEPDFNEFYYLLHNEDARKAVETGEFETGLEHYLSIGKSQGLKINAK